MTTKILESRIDFLNELTGSPKETYTDGANPGNYHLSGAYGGYALDRISNESGGVTSVFNCGYITKRDLYDRINAFIRGYQAGKEGE